MSTISKNNTLNTINTLNKTISGTKNFKISDKGLEYFSSTDFKNDLFKSKFTEINNGVAEDEAVKSNLSRGDFATAITRAVEIMNNERESTRGTRGTEGGLLAVATNNLIYNLLKKLSANQAANQAENLKILSSLSKEKLLSPIQINMGLLVLNSLPPQQDTSISSITEVKKQLSNNLIDNLASPAAATTAVQKANERLRMLQEEAKGLLDAKALKETLDIELEATEEVAKEAADKGAVVQEVAQKLTGALLGITAEDVAVVTQKLTEAQTAVQELIGEGAAGASQKLREAQTAVQELIGAQTAVQELIGAQGEEEAVAAGAEAGATPAKRLKKAQVDLVQKLREAQTTVEKLVGGTKEVKKGLRATNSKLMEANTLVEKLNKSLKLVKNLLKEGKLQKAVQELSKVQVESAKRLTEAQVELQEANPGLAVALEANQGLEVAQEANPGLAAALEANQGLEVAQEANQGLEVALNTVQEVVTVLEGQVSLENQESVVLLVVAAQEAAQRLTEAQGAVNERLQVAQAAKTAADKSLVDLAAGNLGVIQDLQKAQAAKTAAEQKSQEAGAAAIRAIKDPAEEEKKVQSLIAITTALSLKLLSNEQIVFLTESVKDLSGKEELEKAKESFYDALLDKLKEEEVWKKTKEGIIEGSVSERVEHIRKYCGDKIYKIEEEEKKVLNILKEFDRAELKLEKEALKTPEATIKSFQGDTEGAGVVAGEEAGVGVEAGAEEEKTTALLLAEVRDNIHQAKEEIIRKVNEVKALQKEKEGQEVASHGLQELLQNFPANEEDLQIIRDAVQPAVQAALQAAAPAAAPAAVQEAVQAAIDQAQINSVVKAVVKAAVQAVGPTQENLLEAIRAVNLEAVEKALQTRAETILKSVDQVLKGGETLVGRVRAAKTAVDEKIQVTAAVVVEVENQGELQTAVQNLEKQLEKAKDLENDLINATNEMNATISGIEEDIESKFENKECKKNHKKIKKELTDLMKKATNQKDDLRAELKEESSQKEKIEEIEEIEKRHTDIEALLPEKQKGRLEKIKKSVEKIFEEERLNKSIVELNKDLKDAVRSVDRRLADTYESSLTEAGKLIDSLSKIGDSNLSSAYSVMYKKGVNRIEEHRLGALKNYAEKYHKENPGELFNAFCEKGKNNGELSLKKDVKTILGIDRDQIEEKFYFTSITGNRDKTESKQFLDICSNTGNTKPGVFITLDVIYEGRGTCWIYDVAKEIMYDGEKLKGKDVENDEQAKSDATIQRGEYEEWLSIPVSGQERIQEKQETTAGKNNRIGRDM